ncbi:hypothetical protein C1645_256600 [Glomus cerebriforme]|uniref:Uncharacterized protein n=1 Tax=Glomus cerebriforme TaxID=658196 RepID=A0A397SPI3_9GLOM|nr:hypothetical protein C1645_256600 [Glomus cerebriforme]
MIIIINKRPSLLGNIQEFNRLNSNISISTSNQSMIFQIRRCFKLQKIPANQHELYILLSLFFTLCSFSTIYFITLFFLKKKNFFSTLNFHSSTWTKLFHICRIDAIMFIIQWPKVLPFGSCNFFFVYIELVTILV